eukprot:scaffold1303_cov221-Pinguiococcus_pyrenoidosus.AAC.2
MPILHPVEAAHVRCARQNRREDGLVLDQHGHRRHGLQQTRDHIAGVPGKLCWQNRGLQGPLDLPKPFALC